MKILSNGAPHSLFWYIGHHTKAVYKCTISRYVKSRKYGPYGGTYTNIVKTASASLYFHCYNPISYSGHPRGSKKYRLAKMWGGGARGSYLAHGLINNRANSQKCFNERFSSIHTFHNLSYHCRNVKITNFYIFVAHVILSIYDHGTHPHRLL